MKRRVIINSDGKTCTTTNPFGEEPNIHKYEDTPSEQLEYYANMNDWQQAEQDQKTYEISYVMLDECVSLYDYIRTKKVFDIDKLKPGTEHEAEIINNKAIIQ